MMKKIYTFLIALLFLGIVSGQWVQQTTNNNSYPFFDITFVDSDYGWVAGEDGYKTIDGGINWELMITNSNSICFTDQNLGWSVGNNAMIMHTLNGGILWDFQQSGISGEYHFNSVCFIDSLQGWILGVDIEFYGNNFIIINTSNGGDDWSEQISGSCGGQFKSMYDIEFINVNTGWAVGSDVIYKTYDQGENWSIICDDIVIEAYSVCFIDSLNGWIAGLYLYENSGIIFNTVDGGYNWVYQGGDAVPQLNDITFLDELNGWAVGNEGTILHTSDGGQNWEYQESGTLANLNSVCFIDQNTGWICGDSGVILHTENGGIVGIEKPEQEITDFKTYPNPSTLTITVELGLQPAKRTTLIIYNLNGQQLFTQPITKPQTEIDISHLPNGIYIVKVWNDKNVMVQKVIKQ